MYWMRSRLMLVTLLVASAHVPAIAATSIALCCLPHLSSTGDTEECPLHRAAADTCTLTQCPMHGAAGSHGPEHSTAESPMHAHGATTQPSHAGDCQLTCEDGDRSLVVLLGVPGLLPAANTVTCQDAVEMRPASGVHSPPDQIPSVSIPPPRV
ncbi:MAG: hypothetical protein QGI10_07570 [Vicinamibacterales bacterium]|nr:hypothetical protein [Vicinamibacterales bacterium]HJN43039.1 hypothetical protein [Vicinamibacterales bacterium]